MSVHPHKDGRWICTYYPNGIRKDKSFGRGPDAKSSADLFDSEMKKLYSNKGTHCESVVPVQISEPMKPLSQMTFGGLVEEYLQHSRANGSTENHLDSIVSVANALFYPAFGKEKLIVNFDYGRDILPFMTMIANEPSKSGNCRATVTVNKYGHFLVALFNYAIARDYISNNPMRLWKKAKVKKKDIQLTIEDAQKIMHCAAPHLRWAMEVCFNLGTRSGESELLSLKWSDVDYEKKMVHVYGRKTKTDRFIPVSDEFLKKLAEKQAVARTDHIIEFRGRPIRMIRNAFRQAVRKAQISYPVRMYDLRHLFATSLISAGASIGSVSKLMGHARISTTVNVYYQVKQEELERAMSILPKLEVNDAKTGS